MSIARIRWTRALAGALAAEVAQVAAAFAWVAIYSHVLVPGQPLEAYRAHAAASGPWVSLLAGFPLFYAASRWIARDLRTSRALFAIFFTFDLALLLAVGAREALGIAGLVVANYGTKLLACHLGGVHAEARARAAAR